MDKKQHWESIYENKSPEEVSWTQEVPEISLELIDDIGLNKDDAIIDIGGGDSKLSDFLLDRGFTNITVLDISVAALNRLKNRLGDRANQIKYVHSDILDFKSDTKYRLWHDRAAFHFLTESEDIKKYKQIASEAIDGQMIIGTFSESGPEKCSGLFIHQYGEKSMEQTFKEEFEKDKCIILDHQTPFNTIQNFIFCRFTRKE